MAPSSRPHLYLTPPLLLLNFTKLHISLVLSLSPLPDDKLPEVQSCPLWYLMYGTDASKVCWLEFVHVTKPAATDCVKLLFFRFITIYLMHLYCAQIPNSTLGLLKRSKHLIYFKTQIILKLHVSRSQSWESCNAYKHVNRRSKCFVLKIMGNRSELWFKFSP